MKKGRIVNIRTEQKKVGSPLQRRVAFHLGVDVRKLLQWIKS